MTNETSEIGILKAKLERQTKFINNYIGDLTYQHGCGLEMINFATSGTPFFDTDTEAEDYIETLKAAL